MISEKVFILYRHAGIVYKYENYTCFVTLLQLFGIS